jgi:hypothetical protein
LHRNASRRGAECTLSQNRHGRCEARQAAAGARSRGINGRTVFYRALSPLEPPRSTTMSVHVALQPLIALIAGILILIVPRLLNYVVAIYLIIVGLLGLVPMLHL